MDILNPIYVGIGLTKIYQNIKDQNDCMQTNDWTIFSINELKKCENKYGTKMITIGSRRFGMGWYGMLTYIPETDTFTVILEGNDIDSYDKKTFYRSAKYNPCTFPTYAGLTADEQKKCANITTMKFSDYQIRQIQYTYDDLVQCGFFTNIQILHAK
jgi:hypothetical protein